MESTFDFQNMRDGVRLTGYHGSASRVEIPETIGGLPVRVIGTHMFQEDGLFIETITVPSAVKVIEPYAFELCLSLTELKLEEGLERIGAGAFHATALEEVIIPASVEQIDEIGASTCALRFAEGNRFYETDGFGIYREHVLVCVNDSAAPGSYRIRAGTTAVAPDLFADCGALKELFLPASLYDLPEGVLANIKDPFSTDKCIESVLTEPGHPVFFTQDGILYKRTGAGPCGADRVHGTASEDPAKTALELVRCFVPQTEPAIMDGVVRICREAFLFAGVRRITIPVSVKEIGEDAFLENPLETAIFENADNSARSQEIYFPQSDAFLLKNLLKAFGKNGKLYDFSTYDEVLEEKHLNLDRVRMICSRLENRVDPGEGKHALLWASVLGRMEEIVPMIASQNDLPLLKRLAEHGFITDRNIDRLIRAADSDSEKASSRVRIDGRIRNTGGQIQDRHSVQREAAAWLMDYKHTHFGEKEFDFSL